MMTSRPARITSIVLGVLAVLLGGLWMGQGLNLIPGSGMSGNQMWFWIGLVLALVGLALVVAGATRGRRAVQRGATRP